MDKAIQFDEVADLYDFYVSTDIDIPFYQEEFTGQSGDVLELMCGTGRVSIPLHQQGVKLTCVDYSSKMLERFQDKMNRLDLCARLIEADICYMDLGSQFDVIFIPFNSFMELVGKEKQASALQKIYVHLRRGGTFICTLHNPAQRKRLANGKKTFRGEYPINDEQTLLLHSLEQIDYEQGLIKGTQYYEIIKRNGDRLSERQLDIKFSLLDRDQFEKLVRQAGFYIHSMFGDYSRRAFHPVNSPFMIYKLRK